MLIVLSKSLFVGNYASILDIASEAVRKGEKVGVLHIQDSCITLTLDEYLKKLAEAELNAYALKADCEARGLLKKIKGAKIVDYNDWVRLVMEEYDRIVSWT